MISVLLFLGGLVLGWAGSVLMLRKIVEYDIRRNSLSSRNHYVGEDYFDD